MVTDRLTCLLFGHPDTETKESNRYTYENCTRCGTTLNKEITYYGRARNYLLNTRRGSTYEPLEKMRDSDNRLLEPGDRVRWMKESAFPGLKRPTSGRVEYLFEDVLGTRWVKVKRKRHPIPERKLLGFRKRNQRENKLLEDGFRPARWHKVEID